MPNSHSPNQPGSAFKNKKLKDEKKKQEILKLQELYGDVAGEVSASEKIVASSLKAIPPVEGITPSSQSLRYPSSPNITDDTDYVMFQFYNYKPPFANREYAKRYANTGKKFTKDQADKIIQDQNFKVDENVRDYNDMGQYKDTERAKGYNNIILYMPEDISTGFRGQWGGKNLTNFASGVLQAAGADGFDKVKNSTKVLANAIGNVSYIAGAQAISTFVQSTGGDQLSNDEVFGAVSGAILNPNSELLFSGIDMRNFVLNFKLVPRDAKEAAAVNSIVGHFKKATLPSRVPDRIFGNDSSIKRNFIGAPKLVRVSFMSGENEHPHLPRYKMCALTQIDVNYTPDGVYATYEGGQPVAIQMSLNFQETKIVFADEVNANGIGGLR